MTTIEWTDASWNPVTGCTKVSPGCAHCYAERVADRLWAKQYPVVEIETSGPAGTETRARLFADVRCHEDRLDSPLHWKKPRMVFVNSMSDLFHEDVPDEFIDRVFAVMALCPQHVFQILTKRVGRMRAYKDLFTGVDDRVEQAADWIREQIGVNAPKGYEVDSRFQRAAAALAAFSWPLPNVWLGVSVENQHFADERIPLLLQTPAAVRFVSAEPLLGALNIEPFLWDEDDRHDALCGLDLVIVGGESGPKARPLWVPWVRSIKDQCEAAGVSCFVKQLGADVRDRNDAGFTGDFDGSGTCWPEQHEIDDRIESDLDGTRDDYQGAPVRIHLRDRKGGDPSEWPEDLRVRQFPGARG